VVSAAVVDAVRARLVSDAAEPTPERVIAALRDNGKVVSDADLADIVDLLRADMAGLGPLEPLLAEAGTSDIVVNAPDEVWVDRGHGLQRVDTRFRDDLSVRRMAQRLAASVGRRLDDAAPYVDAQLPGDVRLHAVLPPLAPRTYLSLRVMRRRPFSIDELISAAAFPQSMADWLRAVVVARLAFLVTGGTGSGKTTVLSTLLSDPEPVLSAGGASYERLVLIEDTAELTPRHPHVVRLQTRPSNIEGAGAVDLTSLVRQAMRMRPDRLVVGEVRGAEIVDLLGALNTGHEGGCGTLHANRAVDVPARIEALAALGGLGRESAFSQALAALDVVVHLRRSRAGHRRIETIGVVQRSSASEMVVVPALSFDGAGLTEGPGLDGLSQRLESTS
jgi:pilus assembly protein CpaF